MEPAQLHGGVMNFQQEEQTVLQSQELELESFTCVCTMGINKQAEYLPAQVTDYCPGTLENSL